jgi:hypothetical protein
MRLLVAVVASAVVTTAASLTVEERFAIVPEWLLDADVSDAAIRLYAVLLRYGQSSGARMPGRATLARRLRKKSVDTIDRAMRELVDIGAVVVEHRYDGPQRLTNRYHLHARRPGGVSNDFDASSGGGRVNAATPKESDQPDLADAAGGGRKYAAGVAAPVRHNPKHFTQSTTTSPQPPAATADERNLWRAEEDRFLQSLGIADADAYAAEIGALRRDAGHAGGLMNLHSVIRARSRLRSEHVIGCRDELQMRHRGHVGSEQRRGKPLGREFAGVSRYRSSAPTVIAPMRNGNAKSARTPDAGRSPKGTHLARSTPSERSKSAMSTGEPDVTASMQGPTPVVSCRSSMPAARSSVAQTVPRLPASVSIEIPAPRHIRRISTHNWHSRCGPLGRPPRRSRAAVAKAVDQTPERTRGEAVTCSFALLVTASLAQSRLRRRPCATREACRRPATGHSLSVP